MPALAKREPNLLIPHHQKAYAAKRYGLFQVFPGQVLI